MLIIKVFVNLEQIDEVWIQRTAGQAGEVCEYRICKPAGYDTVITHDYNRGYADLLYRAMDVLRTPTTE